MRIGFPTSLVLAAIAGAAMAQTTTVPPAPGAPTEEGQPPGPNVRYVCPGGTDFSALFSKDGELATRTVAGQPEIELPRQRSGSGCAYGDSDCELRGRGRGATLAAAVPAVDCLIWASASFSAAE